MIPSHNTLLLSNEFPYIINKPTLHIFSYIASVLYTFTRLHHQGQDVTQGELYDSFFLSTHTNCILPHCKIQYHP